MSGWSSFMRQATILCFLLAVSLGIVLMAIKHQVQKLEDELAFLNKETAREQETIHVLRAEFSFLTEPERLRRLAAAHTDLGPIGPNQIATFDNLDEMLAKSDSSAGSRDSTSTRGGLQASHRETKR